MSKTPSLSEILKLIYGQDVVPNAYASPAGRLTLAEAETAIQTLIAEARIAGQIDAINAYTVVEQEWKAYRGSSSYQDVALQTIKEVRHD